MWRRAWQPTPVFLPGESRGPRNSAGYSPWGIKKSDMTEATEPICTRIYIYITNTFSSSVTCLLSQLLELSDSESEVPHFDKGWHHSFCLPLWFVFAWGRVHSNCKVITMLSYLFSFHFGLSPVACQFTQHISQWWEKPPWPQIPHVSFQGCVCCGESGASSQIPGKVYSLLLALGPALPCQGREWRATWIISEVDLWTKFTLSPITIC